MLQLDVLKSCKTFQNLFLVLHNYFLFRLKI